MASLQEKMKTIIKDELEGEAELETLPNGHVSGHVISSRFAGLEFDQRRKKLRQIWEKHLRTDEQNMISTMLTYTPEEWHVTLNDDI